MKKLLALAFSLFVTAALAQGDGPAHSMPTFQGPGIAGFGVAGPCTSSQALVWTDNAHDPTCQAIPVSPIGTDFFFTSGRPWCDVMGQGASATGSNDMQPAFAACVAKLQALSGNPGGIIYVPPGFFTANGGAGGTNPLATTGTAPICIVGAGRNATIIQVTVDLDGILLDSPNSCIKNLTIVGFNNRTATHANVNVTSNCVACMISGTIASGGKYFFLNGTDTTLLEVSIGNTYSTGSTSTQLLTRSTAHLIRVASDHGFPVNNPSNLSTINAWAANATMTVGNIVTLSGWYIQVATITGDDKTGGSPPTLAANYGTSFTDNHVTWQLVSPVGMCGLQLDTGATGLDSTHGDYSGAYDYGICQTDTLSGGDGTVGSNYFAGGTTVSAITAGVHLIAGSNFNIADFDVGGGIFNSFVGIDIEANFRGPASIHNGQIISASTGVFINFGIGYDVSGVAVFPGNLANITGIRSSANVGGVSIHDNPLDTNAHIPGSGTMANGVIIDAGSQDYVYVRNNHCSGVVTNCVNAGSVAGVHQIIQTSTGSGEVVGTTASKAVTINPQSTAALNLLGAYVALQHSYNGTSNLTLTQNSDNSGTLKITSAAILGLGTNGNANDWNIGATHGLYSNGGTDEGNGQLFLGAIGATAGGLWFGNTTSGTIKVVPATGALGSSVATIPANTGTIAELNLAQTWSANQTFNTGNLIINGGAATAGLASVTSGGVVSSCAACTLATSLTVPQIFGGTAAGSTLALNSTSSGAPSGDTVTIKAGAITETHNATGVGIGTAPSFLLDVNNNASGVTNAVPLGPARVVVADTTAGGFVVSTFGGNAVNAFGRADGIESAPTAMAAAETIGALSMLPYNGSSYTTQAQFRCQTAETIGAGARGTYCDILATVPTTTSLITTFRAYGNGHNLDFFSGTGSGSPTVSACGTSPGTPVGNDMVGSVAAGSGALTSCVLNFFKTWATAPVCTFSSPTAIASPTVTASTTQLTIGGTSLTSLTLNWICRGYGSS